LIKVKDVTKRFGNITAVDRACFSLNAGESLALLGVNGAGKSTLIKCVLGILDYSGEITLNGLNIKENEKEAKSLAGYVPQEPLFYDMRTRDVLGFFGSIRRVRSSRVDEVLDLVGLREHERKSTSELSGGMRQRLSFAIALLSDPEVLILDEPTSNLDAGARGDFLNLIKEYKNKGKTVLFSSHRLDEVDLLADRALFMESGRVVFEGRPENLQELLGLKININLVVPQGSVERAIGILAREGFHNAESNGRGLNIETDSKQRVDVLKKLLQEEIPISDFKIQEPSMENIIDRIKENGY